MKNSPQLLKLLSILDLRFALALLLSGGGSAMALERVNVDSSGNQAVNGVAFSPSTSGNGRYIVFSTNAVLVPGDANSFYDVYLRDRQLGTTTRVSVDNAGNEVDGSSENPVISADGNFVAFESDATNLISGDTNGLRDIFVKNLISGGVTRVSVATGGTAATNSSVKPSISGDGRYVVFISGATNLVVSDTNSQDDIFLHDRNTVTTTRINLGPANAEANGGSSSPAISDDGTTVVFQSLATSLTNPATNGNSQIFVRNLDSSTTTLVSKSTAGAEATAECGLPDLTSDGRYVIFESIATNLDAADTDGLKDIFLHDRNSGTTSLVSLSSSSVKSNGDSQNARISGSGSHLAFTSSATNFATGDTNSTTDLFVRNLSSGVTHRVSVGPNGEQGDDATWSRPDLLADGSGIVFESSAGNLVPNDTNMAHDIFFGSTTPPTPTAPPSNATAKAAIEVQITATNKKLKAAKQKGQVAKVKRFKAKLRKLKASLRSL